MCMSLRKIIRSINLDFIIEDKYSHIFIYSFNVWRDSEI